MRGILYNKINRDGNRDDKTDDKKEGKFKKFFKEVVKKPKEILKVAVISLAILCSSNSVKADVPSVNGRTFEVRSYNNDAGTSLTGSANVFSGVEWLKLTVGGVWINNGSYPIGSLNLDPYIRFFDGTVVLNYFGNVTLTNMASVLYTTTGVGGSVHFDIGSTTVHAATLLEGAISYPLYDLLYARWLNGLRWDIGNFQLSVKNIEYFAASKAPNTAWAFDYKPRYQGLGFEVGYSDGINKILVGADSDKIRPTLFAEYSRQVYNGEDLLVGVNLNAGMDGFNVIKLRQSPFFPNPNFYVLFGIKVDFPDSKYSAEIERRNISQPSGDKQLVYENGDITLEQRRYIEKAEENILNSQLFGDLIAAYKGASIEELLTVANWIASRIGMGGYDYGAYNDLKEFNIFSPNVKALTERNYNDILYFLREYLKYYKEHGTYEGMPEELKRGVAICAGIHEFVAEFLRANGINAYTMTVVTPKSPHVVAVAFYNDKASIIDYGMRYTTKGNLDDVLNTYSKATGVPILQTQIFGRGGKYLGTYVTPQGKIVQKATSSDGNDWLYAMLDQDTREKIAVVSQNLDLIEDLPTPTLPQPAQPQDSQPTTPKGETPEEKIEPLKENPRDEKVKPSEEPISKEPADIFRDTGIDTKGLGKTEGKKPDVKIAQENKWPDEEPKTPQLPKSVDSALNKIMGDIYDLLQHKGLSVPPKIVVRITINEQEGKITGAKVISGTENDDVKKIIERQIKRVKFEPNPEGETKKIMDYTFVFSNTGSIEF